MKIKAISSPTLQSLYHQGDATTLLRYRFTVDVELYDDGDRYLERKLDSFPESPLTFINCLAMDELSEEYEKIRPPQPTPEEREARCQALLQEINEQLMIRWNQGGFLNSIVDDES